MVVVVVVVVIVDCSNIYSNERNKSETEKK